MFMTAEVLGKFFLLQKDTLCGFPMAAAATTNSLLFVRPRPMFANNIKRSQMMMACCCSVGEQVFSVTPSNNYEVDYLGQSTKGDLNLNFEHLDAVGNSSLLSSNSHVLLSANNVLLSVLPLKFTTP
jgi:hypothetical protein